MKLSLIMPALLLASAPAFAGEAEALRAAEAAVYSRCEIRAYEPTLESTKVRKQYVDQFTFDDVYTFQFEVRNNGNDNDEDTVIVEVLDSEESISDYQGPTVTSLKVLGWLRCK